jgi:hypothetical protein
MVENMQLKNPFIANNSKTPELLKTEYAFYFDFK